MKNEKNKLDKIDFKPDIIILSHVIEHWNNFFVDINVTSTYKWVQILQISF